MEGVNDGFVRIFTINFGKIRIILEVKHNGKR
jgi:hypothetical protein